MPLHKDNGDKWDPKVFKCENCPKHRRIKTEITIRRKERADIAAHRLEFGKEDGDSTTEEDTDYDSDELYEYPYRRQPFETKVMKRYLDHLADVHNITSTDMRDANPPGLDGYVGTGYSIILSRCCTICNCSFDTIREYEAHKNTEGAKEVAASIKKGTQPRISLHFSRNEIQTHIDKIKRQKEEKTDAQRLRRSAKRPPKPKYSAEIIAADKSCARAGQAIRENERLTCKICKRGYNKKNYNQHCKSKRHRAALFRRCKRWFHSIIKPESIEKIVNTQAISSI
jgi:hypothetical protein